MANSFANPRAVYEFNSLSVLNLLESIRTVRPETRFYQASSSEMYAGSIIRPINPQLRLQPLSPYGCSKAAGQPFDRRVLQGLLRTVRRGRNLCSIMKSILRPETYFVKKVIRSALRIRDGSEPFMTLRQSRRASGHRLGGTLRRGDVADTATADAARSSRLFRHISLPARDRRSCNSEIGTEQRRRVHSS